MLGPIFSESELPPCTFGPRNCHKTSYCSQRQLTIVRDLTDVHQRLLTLRSKQSLHAGSTICEHHKQLYLHRYTSKIASKLCSDPFFRHSKLCRGSTVITMALVDAHPSLGLVPGNRICEACKRRLYHTQKMGNSIAVEEHLYDMCIGTESELEVSDTESKKEAFEAAAGCSVKRKRVKHERQSCVKRTTPTLRENATGVMYASLERSQISARGTHEAGEFRLSDYVILMNDVKKKFSQEESREKKIEYLTLAPHSWSREKTMKFFGSSERQVREAIKVKGQSGILSTREKKPGRPVSEEVKASIRAFYEDDSVSYCLPGKKDTLQGHQKRLLLMNQGTA